MRSTWKALTQDLSPEDLELLTLYRDFCRGLPETEEQVHSTQVQYVRKRIFTSGYVKVTTSKLAWNCCARHHIRSCGRPSRRRPGRHASDHPARALAVRRGTARPHQGSMGISGAGTALMGWPRRPWMDDHRHREQLHNMTTLLSNGQEL